MAVKKAEKVEKEPKVKKASVKKVAPKAEKAEKVVKAEKAPKATKVEKAPKVAKKTDEKYFYAVGRRKTSVAQVRIFVDEKATDNDLIINGKKFKEYFPMVVSQNSLLAPFKALGMQGKFRMTVLVRGGGKTGQVEAVRLGIARALVVFDESVKKTLKDLGLLTRDSREVERKKAGLKKARKSPQWAKR